MLAGFERATWLASYCSAQECLYKEFFADNDKYSDLNNTFIEDLVHLYAAILKFLIQAHHYYSQRTTGDCFSSIPVTLFTTTFFSSCLGCLPKP
jgi:hypothetical protein